MPEDRRVALAALAVTAIVGVGAPMGTVVATNSHDNTRLHIERAQADRAELRKVLDDAADALTVSYARFYDENVREEDEPQKHNPVRAFLRLRPELDRITRHYNRVAIRLGNRADATKRMNEALSVATEIVSHEATKRKGSHRPTSDLVEFSRALDRYTTKIERFIDAANRVARSTIA